MHNILITDDSATARMVIKRCLEMIGCENCCYHQAANGQKALEILRSQPIDLLITDMVMPEMDGKQLLMSVRSSPKLCNVKVVVITSLANPALEKELTDLGASSVISKPVSPPKIQECIAGLFTQE